MRLGGSRVGDYLADGHGREDDGVADIAAGQEHDTDMSHIACRCAIHSGLYGPLQSFDNSLVEYAHDPTLFLAR